MNTRDDSSPSPHYLRVVKALAFAALASGCTGTTIEAPPMADSGTIADATAIDASIADAGPSPDVTHEAEDDTGLPFTSGPIAPPELPASMA